jgi:branched-chain amino acid transport system permease protein
MKWLKILTLLVLLACVIAFPQVFSDGEITTIAFFTLLFAAMVTGWNILAGFSGYIALGHAVYFGIGAYSLAIICDHWGISATTAWGPVPAGYNIFLLAPVAGLVVAVIAIPSGWVALRVRRHAFIIITIAIFFIGQLLAYNLRAWTKGSSGFDLPLPFQWGGNAYNIPFYYAVLALLLLALLIAWAVRNSKFGLGLLAIRDDEDRAKGLGVKTEFSKLAAFVISAWVVGTAGALWAYFIGTVYPNSAFDPTFDLAVALMSFLGGLGTLAGPILGALLLEPVRQYLASSAPDWYLVIYGALFLVVLLLLPRGILPTLQDSWSQYRARLLDRLREHEVAVSPTAPLPVLMRAARKHGVSLRVSRRERQDSAVITPLPEQGEPAVVNKEGVNL